MTDILVQTDRRIAELEEQLRVLREFKRTYQAVAMLLGSESGLQNIAPAAPSVPAQPTPSEQQETDQTVRKRAKNAFGSAEIIAYAVALIRAHGAPMSRRQVFDALADSGIVIAGTDPLKVLGTTLWRAKDDIVSLDGFGYWPKMDPYPPARYFPNSAA